ncbi:En/Spm-like transposon protein-like [Arabidopsis thaliana]|uniref:En/Spm-like transposon protein-like n=1 Tax=Arabidopsis thaliana TaxID=3702 RepID=Q9LI66_ARATH|nr:En/Spm-like transposon protein-like [Arabidopsis thaliana]
MRSFNNQDLRSQPHLCTSLAAIPFIRIHMEVEEQLQIMESMSKCDWFNPVIGRGVRVNNLSMVDVNSNKTYSKFEPFMLASQAGQVSFLSYPRVRPRREVWLSVIKVNPRSRIVGLVDDVVMQQKSVRDISIPDITKEDIIHIDLHNREFEDITHNCSKEEEQSHEFGESDEDVESKNDCNDSENESE